MTAKEVSKYRSESPTMPVQDKERRKEGREGRKGGDRERSAGEEWEEGREGGIQ